MKRRPSSEDDIIFFSIPSELLSKIQSYLLTVSLIFLSRTCKRFYSFQQTFMVKVKEEMSIQCINRMQIHLDQLALLELLSNFLPLFKSTIGGSRIAEYLCSLEPRSTLVVSMPKSIDFQAALDYLKANINLEENYISSMGNYNIFITSKFDSKKQNLAFNVEETDDLLVDFTPIITHATLLTNREQLQISTDLQKLYCSNFWYLLKHLGSTLEKMK